MNESKVVEILRAVSLTDLAAMTNIPADLRQKIADMMAAGVTSADVASMVDGAGYKIVIVPNDGDMEDPDEMGDYELDDDVEEPSVEVNIEVEVNIGSEDDDDDDLEDDYEDDDEEAGGLMGLLNRLRSVFGKAISFESENATISRNRKRAAARAPHEFTRAVWSTRKGVIRCRICGGPAPTDGIECSGLAMSKDAFPGFEYPTEDDAEMGRDDDLGELTIRSAAFAEAMDLMVDALGCYSQRDAHYLDDNPFRDEGLACVNCVAYCPEVGGCYWVEGSILPDSLCKLWTIPEAERMSAPMEKSIVETGGKFEVMSADGSKSFGTYGTKAEAEARLAQVERFSKADTYTPPAGVQEEGKRAEAWIADGNAGSGFTATGRRRASDLAAGNAVSLDTIRRMSSYLARHEVDKKGAGWSPGSPGYPSPGRVAWAAWGGDPAVSWTRGILSGIDKENPTMSDVHVDVPMGSRGRQKKRPVTSPAVPLSKGIGVGSFVSWDSSGGRARGKVERISTDRPIRVPNSSFTIDASEDDPAVLVVLWTETRDGWRPTDQRVGHRLSTLTGIEPLQRAIDIAGIFTKADERRFTLGPWYVPDAYDAHGEWTDSTELQTALWGYVRTGDRSIRLQHNVDIVAGEWVEAMTWPYAVSVPMLDAVTGTVAEQEFPPETVFMGVVWEPWAWELVKEGKIRGYSMGGNGQRVTVDLPTEGSL